jgi:integrase/recombinase XerD
MHDRLELEHGHPCRDKRDIHLKEDYGVHASTSEYKRQHTTAGIDLDGTRNGDAVLALKPQIVEKLFDNVPGKRKQTRLRNEIAVRLNWYTGCRADELSRMQVEKIDWDQCCINIRSAKINAKENPELARRDVFFPESFKVQLKRWCERVRHAYSGDVEPDSGAILVTTKSDQMQPSLINDIVKEAARNAGVQHPLRPADPGPDDTVEEWFVTTHRIRRSAISHWVNDCEPISLHQARQLAGHARIQQTMDYVEDDQDQLGEDYHRSIQ